MRLMHGGCQFPALAPSLARPTRDFGDDRTLQATLTRTSLDMTHEVHYVEWRWLCEPWTPPQQPSDQPFQPTVRDWDELNEDRNATWGTRLPYRQPLDQVSQVGFLLAASTKDHPKIPNYNIVNIPRDPGNSTVVDVGAGLSHREGPLQAALEVVFEPGGSHTWAFADTTILRPSGAKLEPGDKTVDNRFTFRNMRVALGLDRDGERFGFQLGLGVRQISYRLEQLVAGLDIVEKSPPAEQPQQPTLNRPRDRACLLG